MNRHNRIFKEVPQFGFALFNRAPLLLPFPNFGLERLALLHWRSPLAAYRVRSTSRQGTPRFRR
jgi:hypothetical protein